MPSLKPLVTCFLLISVYSSYAQGVSQPDTVQPTAKEFVKVEIEAEYPGGIAAWVKFLQKNLNASVPANNNAPNGKYPAMAMFIVDLDGSLSEVKAVTKFGYGMEEEMLRVINKSGKWSPASQDGKPLRAYRKQPFIFLVEDGDFTVTSAEPYTLFTSGDNEITITARKIKPADININVPGGKAIALGEGRFLVKINKPGRVIIEIVNSKKDDKLIGEASFEVKAK